MRCLKRFHRQLLLNKCLPSELILYNIIVYIDSIMLAHCGICDKTAVSMRLWYGNFLCNECYNTDSIRIKAALAR